MQRKLVTALVPILMSLAIAARADGPRARFFDSATGKAIASEAVTRSGSDGGVIRADGFRPMTLRRAEGQEIETVDVYLEPEVVPAEVDPRRIAALHRSDATLIQGFVVDDHSGAAIAGAQVVAGSGERTQTDDRGFFRMWVASPKPNADGALRFTAAGYVGEVREHVELWPFGDWTYRLKLRRGSGTVTIDEGASRTREHGIESDEITVVTTGRMASDAEAQAIEQSMSIPSTIRVQTSTGVVEYRTLEDYCRYVLPAEWIPSWALLAGGLGANSLRAGAVAIRTYAIGYVQQPYNANADICGTTSCQAYDPTKENSYASAAVRDTAGVVMANASGAITYKMTEYSAENNAKNCYDTVGGVKQYKTCTCPDGSTGDAPKCIADPVCVTESRYGHGRGMCQWGSSRWASGLYTSGPNKNTAHPHGTKTWQEILLHYYPTLSLAQGSALAVGDRVKTSKAGVNVRECGGAGIGEGVNCPTSAPDRGDGALGRIVDGPQWLTSSGGFTWWRVRWDSDGGTGWTAENYLRRVIGASSQAAFSGTVTEAKTGAPVAGAAIAWGTYAATSAANGTYAFEGVPCRTETLVVSKSGFSAFAQSYAPSCDATNVKDVALAPAVARRRAAGH